MIHIAYINIAGLSPEIYGQLLASAPAQRQERAARYHRFEDQLRCVTADALLRWAVAQTPEVSVPYTIECNTYGKPRLAGEEDFHFNLSHSGKWVVIAYGSSLVGVDVEAIRMDAGKETIARRQFTKAEYDYIFSREPEQAERFFRIWTGKESYLKYLGTGLTKSLNSFRVLPPMVEEPPGTPRKGLYLHSFRLEDSCLSLCCEDQEVDIQELTAEDILIR